MNSVETISENDRTSIDKTCNKRMRQQPNPVLLPRPTTDFVIHQSDGKARVGALWGHPTPAVMLPTFFGQVSHLTPDLINSLPQYGIASVRLSHMITHIKAVAPSSKSLAQYLNLSNRKVVLTLHDPSRAPFLPSSNGGCTVETFSGRKTVTPKEFAEAVQSLRPDAFVLMHDTVTSELAPTFRKQLTSLKRNSDWSKPILEAINNSHKESNERPLVFGYSQCAPVAFNPSKAPQDNTTTAHESIKLIQNANVDGIVIGGVGLNETHNERSQAMTYACSAFSNDVAPRMICMNGEPLAILQAVQHGIDLFDTDYPLMLSNFGWASSFRTWPDASENSVLAKEDDSHICVEKETINSAKSSWQQFTQGSHDTTITPSEHVKDPEHYSLMDRYADTKPRSAVKTNDEMGLGDGTKLSLRDRRFERDTSPLVSGCTCYTCKHHSRAYIQHLLNTHEMLSDTLLYVHNLHHYAKFFAAVRKAISLGRLEEYISWFVEVHGKIDVWATICKSA